MTCLAFLAGVTAAIWAPADPLRLDVVLGRGYAGAVAGALSPFAEPGDCDSCFVLELDDQGLLDLDPGQATAVLSSGPACPSREDASGGMP